jgi:hypothetical protein
MVEIAAMGIRKNDCSNDAGCRLSRQGRSACRTLSKFSTNPGENLLELPPP